MKNYLISIFYLFLFTLLVSGQEKPKGCGCPYDNIEEVEFIQNEPIFTAEINPSFIGGKEALKKYVQKLIQHPAKNAEDSLQYEVFCVFIVEKDGNISHPKVIHGSDSIFNNEAIRLISTMPKWIPGKTDGESVRCWENIALHFGY